MTSQETFVSTTVPERVYREKAILGHGGESIVYLVEALEKENVLPGEFALKHLNHRALRNMTQGERILKRFERQVDIMRQLDHPAIVTLVDAGDPAERFVNPFIVMEYAPGQNLRQALRTCLKENGEEEGMALPFDEILRIMDPVIDALTYAHSRPTRIIHRDLKPENIMVGDAVKLLDFGAGKEMVRNGSHETVLTSAG
ncbi:MAG TPA: protein kinase, partial [Methylophilaceae bacterium]|nr:protein kinase [Methylophilaceae bacterium]